VPLTLLGKLYKVKLFALLRPRHMTRQERIHESLEIWPPPLGQGVANFPIFIDAFTCELRSYRCKALIQTCLEAFNLVIVMLKIVARSRLTSAVVREKEMEKRNRLQLEESIGDLQHQYMRVVMFMAHQNTLASPPHAVLLIVFFKTL
jgi:hypothetical protein